MCCIWLTAFVFPVAWLLCCVSVVCCFCLCVYLLADVVCALVVDAVVVFCLLCVACRVLFGCCILRSCPISCQFGLFWLYDIALASFSGCCVFLCGLRGVMCVCWYVAAGNVILWFAAIVIFCVFDVLSCALLCF